MLQPVLVTAHAVTKALDRPPPDIVDSPLPDQKLVLPSRRQQDEESPEAQILDIAKSPVLVATAHEFRAVNPVAVDELRIDRARVLVWRNAAGDVKPVAVWLHTPPPTAE